MSDLQDAARFTALYDAYRPRVHAYVVSRVGVQAVEGITCEVFCVAWRRIRDLPDEPLPWLLRIARDFLHESYRRQNRQDALACELRTWASGRQHADEDAEAAAERAGMLRALAALPDCAREPLTLLAWHGLSPAEAANVLGCSKAVFYVRLHRARLRLERAATAESRTPGAARGPSLSIPQRKAVR